MSYDYAKRGGNCNSSLRVLTSNRIYLPLDYTVYDFPYTKMWQYPASSYDFINNVGHLERPEDIKVEPFVLNKSGCRTCTR
jgi:hypothetical protein